VPDVYQGDELQALALVDPDNRRPVDWALRRRLLAELRSGAEPTGETRKLSLIVRALDLRAERPDAFSGDYEPVDVGPDAIAFVRGGSVLAAAALRAENPGLSLPLPAGTWRDVLGDRRLSGPVSLAELLGDHGVALLERADR
jgi:(1->4)-alpha-D-glucan 1-alpha-D-glucosylmutase